MKRCGYCVCLAKASLCASAPLCSLACYSLFIKYNTHARSIFAAKPFCSSSRLPFMPLIEHRAEVEGGKAFFVERGNDLEKDFSWGMVTGCGRAFLNERNHPGVEIGFGPNPERPNRRAG